MQKTARKIQQKLLQAMLERETTNPSMKFNVRRGSIDSIAVRRAAL
jgi:hypothetical protein